MATATVLTMSFRMETSTRTVETMAMETLVIDAPPWRYTTTAANDVWGNCDQGASQHFALEKFKNTKTVQNSEGVLSKLETVFLFRDFILEFGLPWYGAAPDAQRARCSV